MKPNAKLKESRMRKKEKSNDSENCKKRLLTDKLKLMHSALKEHSKKVKDKPEKERDLNNKSVRESKLILRLPDKDNLPKSKLVLLSKLESKERTT